MADFFGALGAYLSSLGLGGAGGAGAATGAGAAGGLPPDQRDAFAQRQRAGAALTDAGAGVGGGGPRMSALEGLASPGKSAGELQQQGLPTPQPGPGATPPGAGGAPQAAAPSQRPGGDVRSLNQPSALPTHQEGAAGGAPPVPMPQQQPMGSAQSTPGPVAELANMRAQQQTAAPGQVQTMPAAEAQQQGPRLSDLLPVLEGPGGQLADLIDPGFRGDIPRLDEQFGPQIDQQYNDAAGHGLTSPPSGGFQFDPQQLADVAAWDQAAGAPQNIPGDLGALGFDLGRGGGALGGNGDIAGLGGLDLSGLGPGAGFDSGGLGGLGAYLENSGGGGIDVAKLASAMQKAQAGDMGIGTISDLIGALGPNFGKISDIGTILSHLNSGDTKKMLDVIQWDLAQGAPEKIVGDLSKQTDILNTGNFGNLRNLADIMGESGSVLGGPAGNYLENVPGAVPGLAELANNMLESRRQQKIREGGGNPAGSYRSGELV